MSEIHTDALQRIRRQSTPSKPLAIQWRPPVVRKTGLVAGRLTHDYYPDWQQDLDASVAAQQQRRRVNRVRRIGFFLGAVALSITASWLIVVLAWRLMPWKP